MDLSPSTDLSFAKFKYFSLPSSEVGVDLEARKDFLHGKIDFLQ